MLAKPKRLPAQPFEPVPYMGLAAGSPDGDAKPGPPGGIRGHV